MKCQHKRTNYTGKTLIQLDSKGVFIRDTAQLIYKCCDCNKEVAGATKYRKRAILREQVS